MCRPRSAKGKRQPRYYVTPPDGGMTHERRRRLINQDYNDRPMFDATCSECGQPAQVPFQPSGDRPVFCRDCFQKQRSSRQGGGGGGGDRQMFDAVCATCGQPTQVPFEPRGDRPVYCREHFKRERN